MCSDVALYEAIYSHNYANSLRCCSLYLCTTSGLHLPSKHYGDYSSLLAGARYAVWLWLAQKSGKTSDIYRVLACLRDAVMAVIASSLHSSHKINYSYMTFEEWNI